MPKKPDPSDIDLENHPEILFRLHAERERTGIGSTMIREVSPNVPKSLTKNRAHNLIGGAIRYIKAEELEFFQCAYAAQPTVERVVLTDEIMGQMETMLSEKNLTVVDISKALRRQYNLSSTTLLPWFKRTVKTAKRKHLQVVMNWLETQGLNNRHHRVPKANLN